MSEPNTIWGKELVKQHDYLKGTVSEFEKLIAWAKGALFVLSPVFVGASVWILLNVISLKIEVAGINANLASTTKELEGLKTSAEAQVKEQSETTDELRKGAADMSNLLIGLSNTAASLQESVTSLQRNVKHTVPLKTIWWRQQVTADDLADDGREIELRVNEGFRMDPALIRQVSAKLGLPMPRALGTSSLAIIAELSPDRKFIRVDEVGEPGDTLVKYLKKGGAPFPIELELTYSEPSQ